MPEPVDVPVQPIPFAVALQMEAAQRLGMGTRILDPEYGYLFEIEHRGRTRAMLGGRSPLNDAIASRLAEDKFYTLLLLQQAGFRVPRTVRCLSDYWEAKENYRDRIGPGAAFELAEAVGYPLVVKPNRLSHGKGISVARDEEGLEIAIRRAFDLDTIALAQELAPGRDFRLDFLDGEFLVGYERSGVRLSGDGRRTIGELFDAFDPRFASEARRERLTSCDEWRRAVDERGWSQDRVLAEGEELAFEAEILNLNRLAVASPITELPAATTEACLAMAEVLNLRHFGVDLRAPSLEEIPRDATILELNASPLLAHLYRLGHTELVLGCQMRVLRKAFESL